MSSTSTRQPSGDKPSLTDVTLAGNTIFPDGATAQFGKVKNCTIATTRYVANQLQYNLGNSEVVSTLSKKVNLGDSIFVDSINIGNSTTPTVTITGNLVVNGTTASIKTENTVINDNIIGLNGGLPRNAVPSKDSGLIIYRGTGNQNAFMGWDETNDCFTLGYTESDASTIQTSLQAFSLGTLSANLIATSVDTESLDVTGETTLTGALKANGGIMCDTDRFTVADSTGDTAIKGTLAVTGITTLTGALKANGGIMCDTDRFTVADSTGNTAIKGTLSVDGKLYANGGIVCGDTKIAGDLIVDETVTINGGSIDTTDQNETIRVFESAANLYIGGKSTNILIGTDTNPISGSATTVTVGASNDNINILGNLLTKNVNVRDKQITLNYDGLTDETMKNAGIVIQGYTSAYIKLTDDLKQFAIKTPKLLGEKLIATTADVDAEKNRAIAREDAISDELTELKESLDPANQKLHELLLDIVKNYVLGDIGTMIIDYTYPKLQPMLTEWFNATTNVAATAVEAVLNWWNGIDIGQIIEDWLEDWF